MTSAPPPGSTDLWDRRTRRAMGFMPYFTLGVSVLLTLLITDPRWPSPWVTTGVAALAGLWVLWMFTLHPGWVHRPVLRVLAYAGLWVFFAVLVLMAPWFGFFSFTGYLYLEYLPGRWGTAAGVAGTALIAATSQVGGMNTLRDITVTTLFLYLLVVVFNLAVAGGMAFVGWVGHKKNEERRAALVEVTETNLRLEAALRENAGLHAQLLAQARQAGTTDERQRMAREIHDTLAQGLTGIITQVQAAQRAAEHPERWRRHLDTAAKLARDSLADARRSVHAVRPEPLENARLPEALAEVTEQWSAHHGVPAEFVATGTARSLHPEIETTLLRTTQEALANVAKHAAASRVGLTLSYMEDLVTLDVRDDGVGFDSGALGHDDADDRTDPCDGGFGLTAMRQRVQLLNGHLEIESDAGSGTAISVNVPAVAVGAAT